jgi:threonine/homoserine/homoserine lactone efflux protein
MTIDLFLALVFFAFATAFSPGPNNTLLMASGVSFGLRKTIPMIFGVAIGFPLMIGCIGLGLGKIFETYPLIYTTMKYAGATYMLYLAWKIATSKFVTDEKEVDTKPLSFLHMASFQWINPKAWIMAVTALSTYTIASAYLTGVAYVVGAFFVMGIGSATTWVVFGASLRHVFRDPRYFKMINWALAASLVLSLVPMIWH